MPIEISRYHDISCGHRVVGHESKCRGLHGHNYRITFHASAENLDNLGRIIDFGVLKSAMCAWIEANWDHRMLLWDQDPFFEFVALGRAEGGISTSDDPESVASAVESLFPVPFNPTAENMAAYLLNTVGPIRLADTGVYLTRVVVEETRKCSAVAFL